MNETLTWILDLVQSVDPVLRTLLAGLAMLCETSLFVGLVIPGDTVVLVASTAVTTPLQYFGLIAAVVLGALCGESLGFALGRFVAPRARHTRFGRFMERDSVVSARQYLNERGGIAVFLSRFLPVLHSFVPFAAGLSTMRYRRFIAWTLPACLIWAFAYVSVGSLAAQGYRDVAGTLKWAGYLFVAIIIVFIGVVYLVKKLIARHERKRVTLAQKHTHSATTEE